MRPSQIDRIKGRLESSGALSNNSVKLSVVQDLDFSEIRPGAAYLAWLLRQRLAYTRDCR